MNQKPEGAQPLKAPMHSFVSVFILLQMLLIRLWREPRYIDPTSGLTNFPRDGGTIQELFEQADKALLEAKRSGKNRIYLVGKPQANVTDTKKHPQKLNKAS